MKTQNSSVNIAENPGNVISGACPVALTGHDSLIRGSSGSRTRAAPPLVKIYPNLVQLISLKTPGTKALIRLFTALDLALSASFLRLKPIKTISEVNYA